MTAIKTAPKSSAKSSTAGKVGPHGPSGLAPLINSTGVATGREAMDLIRKAQAAAKSTPAPAKAGKAPKAAKAPKAKRVTSGMRIREMILAGDKTTDEILAVIRKEFPELKTGPSDVSWNRGKLRRDGVANVPTALSVLQARGLNAQGEPAKAKAPKAAAKKAGKGKVAKVAKAPKAKAAK